MKDRRSEPAPQEQDAGFRVSRRMARYYFNTQNDEAVTDGEGVELSDGQDAEVEAVVLTGELLREHAKEFWKTGSFTVTVTDDNGLALFAIITEAIRSPASSRDH